MSKLTLERILTALAFTTIALLAFKCYEALTQAPPQAEILLLNIEARGVVKEVMDGDTLKIEITELNFHAGIEKGKIETIRLVGVNAPELKWRGGEEAKNFLEDLCLNKEVYLDVDDLVYSERGPYRDRYGRVLSMVYVKAGGEYINLSTELMKENHAEIKVAFASEFSPRDWMPAQ